MAARLLLIILINSFHEIKSEDLPRPVLTLDRLVMKESDSVTLNCSAPSHVPESRCCFYSKSQQTSDSSSCVQTLTGSQLLKKTNRRSPAEIKVRCLYWVRRGGVNSSSADSQTTIITINNLLPPELTLNPLVITESDSVTLHCQTPSPVPEYYFNFNGGKSAKKYSCLKTLTGAELLSLSHQRSPATVDVTCFYLVSHPSPKSNNVIITIQFPRPELTVNPLVITESDSVMVNCQTPAYVPVNECSLYFMRSKTSRTISCEQTLTGTELLSLSHQSSPAEVKLACFYTVEQRGGHYRSPLSNMSSVRIRNVQPTTLQTTTTTVLDVTTGLTLSTTTTRRNTDGFSSASVTSVKPASVSKVVLTTPSYPSTSVTSNTKQKLLLGSEPWRRILFVAGPGLGVAVGAVLLCGALLCYSSRSEKYNVKRSQDCISGNTMLLNTFNNKGQLAADDGYNVITHVPAADAPSEFVQVNKQESRDNSDIYHVYSTIPDDAYEPNVSALRDTTYCAIQADSF